MYVVHCLTAKRRQGDSYRAPNLSQRHQGDIEEGGALQLFWAKLLFKFLCFLGIPRYITREGLQKSPAFLRV